ncbi:MAG: FixH family protein, partial [Pseudomonadales bacterium]
VSQQGHYQVSFTSSLAPLEINRIHTWVVHVEDARGNPIDQAELSISGGMPLHDHGLPTEPRATRYLGGGDYLVEGMKFHMSGPWQVNISIIANGKLDTVTFGLDL